MASRANSPFSRMSGATHPRDGFINVHDTTEPQNGHKDTETLRRVVLCASVDFCVFVVCWVFVKRVLDRS